ncbi:helix-hairpin-helix domain-containing protein [Marinifilum sp. RC60d5]|uniref:helix-hairpin-helix domain-containing protein n=1 Tax=Marinifilum sp. RC60d5 TaxID=3458414 RepID=UPI00403654E7
MSLRKNIKEYFTYSTAEKRGILLLLILLVGIYIVPVFLKSDNGEEIVFDEEKQAEFQKMIKGFEGRSDRKNEVKYFKFDPNTASEEQLRKLGFKEFQIKNLKKYRSFGGRIKNKSDLQKIYGITKDDYNRLKAFIQIKRIAKRKIEEQEAKKRKTYLFAFNPNELSISGWDSLGVDNRIANRIQNYIKAGGEFNSKNDLKRIYGFDTLVLAKLIPYIKIPKQGAAKYVRVKRPINLNNCDTTELKSLPGIGSVLSKRIIKYRNMLGGFVQKKQLLEVYGVSKDKYGKIIELLTVDTTQIIKIRLSFVNSEKLYQHPYISRRTAVDIIRYRQKTGGIRVVSELKTNNLIGDSLYFKLRPYLSIE